MPLFPNRLLQPDLWCKDHRKPGSTRCCGESRITALSQWLPLSRWLHFGRCSPQCCGARPVLTPLLRGSLLRGLRGIACVGRSVQCHCKQKRKTANTVRKAFNSLFRENILKYVETLIIPFRNTNSCTFEKRNPTGGHIETTPIIETKALHDT